MPSSIEQLRKLSHPKVEPLALPEPVKHVADRLGLTVALTCRDAPEQYEVSRNDTPSGFIRVRWGGMSVAYPDAGDEELYNGAVDGFGGFTNREREAKLLFALSLIAARMMRA